MRSIREYIDPGGRLVGRRLYQLRATLECLGDTVTNAILQTISGVVRHTALHVLDDLAQYLPGPCPLPLRLSKHVRETIERMVQGQADARRRQ